MRTNMKKPWWAAALLWSGWCVAQEQELSVAFEAQAEVRAWTLAGGAALDAERGRSGGSLELPPGSSAVWNLRAEDGAGTVTTWVYDDGTPPKQAKKRRAGPRWGIISAAGRALVSGHLYAPYIAGGTTYSLGEYSPAKRTEQPYHRVYYLGIRRKTGWRPWTFAFDPDQGLTVLCDGKDVNARRKRFDWLYNDLDPDFREQFRPKIRYHARAMYHGGYLAKNPGIHYWQSDPANNHRWRRNAGLVLCALAAADGSAEEQWLLSRVRAEMDYVTKWLPEDGTCHEGPGYLVFGTSHLTVAVQAMNRCFGTKYLEQPYFKNTPAFVIHCLQPGLTQVFPFGDAGGGIGNYAAFLYKGASLAQDKDLHAGLEAIRAIRGESFEMFSRFALLWYDPELEGGSLDQLPQAAFFEDLGLLTGRDGWAANNVGAMFKCGPFRGYRLNAFRNEGPKPRYINVAHDDPDANSFIIHSRGLPHGATGSQGVNCLLLTLPMVGNHEDLYVSLAHGHKDSPEKKPAKSEIESNCPLTALALLTAASTGLAQETVSLEVLRMSSSRGRHAHSQ